jgi:hypothetical protein
MPTLSTREELETRYDRVREHTAPIVNRRLDAATRARTEQCIHKGRDAIIKRLSELDKEWDIDRALMALFPILGGASFLGGLARYRRKPLFGRRRKGLFFLFGVQLGFMFFHAAVGWCPPVSVLRRLGFRTSREIEAERYTLKQALDSNRSWRDSTATSIQG